MSYIRVLKVYIWTDVLEDYTSGFIIAFATTLEAARKAAIDNRPDYYDERTIREATMDKPTILTIENGMAFICSGGG